MTKPNEPKGFAGLEDMASNIDVPPLPTSTIGSQVSSRTMPEQPKHEPMIGVNVPTPSGARGQGFEVNESRLPPTKQKSSSFGKWVFGIFGGLMILGMISAALDSGKPKSNPASYSTASTPDPVYQAPAPVVARTYEDRPPVGSGISFSDNQIRYCLSQDLRLNGWKASLNEYSQSAIDAFNNAVADYNSRCSNYRYRRGALERVRAEVEQNHYLLQGEGSGLAGRNP
jgi:hypothetical protein